jgi:hypothetical protein
MASAQCLSNDVLTAYHCGALAGDAWDSAAAHLKDCPSCLERLDRMPTTDPVLAALRHSGAPDTALYDSVYARAMARLTDSEPPAAHPVPGTMLRDYRLLEPLGEGGMGVVYKALHTRLDRIVALKVLRRGRRDAAVLARFDREMRAVGRFRHENIVQASDAGEVDGVPFLVMEFIEGQDLAKLVRERGSLRPADACEMVRQAALGLAHAHRAGMVHRDIKPSNLMLTPHGVVKILDLGLALLQESPDPPANPAAPDHYTWDDHHALTDPNQALGTRDYMAPEQWKTPHQVDARADVYGLGCTLLYLLTGRTPRPSETRLVAGLPPGIVENMIAPEPADRFRSAAEVADALAPHCRGSDLASLAAGQPPRARSHRFRWWAVAAVPVVALGLLAWMWPKAEKPTGLQTITVPISWNQAVEAQRQWAVLDGVPIVLKNSLGMSMVYVPPGNLPQHGGSLTAMKAFRIGAHEVTVKQFREFVQATGHKPISESMHGGMTKHSDGMPRPTLDANWEKPGVATGDNHPVTQVAYDDAAAFCEWLSKKEGVPYRLPTYDEWRWACKGGSHALYFFGDASDEIDKYAWTNANSPDGPQPVGKLQPNSWGLYDMIGNVREWTSDIASVPGRKFRIVAGGSVNSDPKMHGIDSKGGFEDWVASNGLGFRVVRELP